MPRRLFAEDPDGLIAEAKAKYDPVATFSLFSGGNDSTVLAHRCRDHYDELAWIDTGTAVPGVEDFVRAYAQWVGKELRVLRHDFDAYRLLVLGGVDPHGKVHRALGFPGPGQHGRAYTRLKERQIERLLREAKLGQPRNARVLFLTGLRRAESRRRAKHTSITRRFAAVFCNPLIDWEDVDMRDYRRTHELPESDVAALLHRSGECNCGSFAGPGERDDLRALYPDWWADRIAPLEDEAQRRGLPFGRWGVRHQEPAPKRTGEMCSDCQLRLEAA